MRVETTVDALPLRLAEGACGAVLREVGVVVQLVPEDVVVGVGPDGVGDILTCVQRGTHKRLLAEVVEPLVHGPGVRTPDVALYEAERLLLFENGVHLGLGVLVLGRVHGRLLAQARVGRNLSAGRDAAVRMTAGAAGEQLVGVVLYPGDEADFVPGVVAVEAVERVGELKRHAVVRVGVRAVVALVRDAPGQPHGAHLGKLVGAADKLGAEAPADALAGLDYLPVVHADAVEHERRGEA